MDGVTSCIRRCCRSPHNSPLIFRYLNEGCRRFYLNFVGYNMAILTTFYAGDIINLNKSFFSSITDHESSIFELLHLKLTVRSHIKPVLTANNIWVINKTEVVFEVTRVGQTQGRTFVAKICHLITTFIKQVQLFFA